jgi:hypothetical protein
MCSWIVRTHCYTKELTFWTYSYCLMRSGWSTRLTWGTTTPAGKWEQAGRGVTPIDATGSCHEKVLPISNLEVALPEWWGVAVSSTSNLARSDPLKKWENATRAIFGSFERSRNSRLAFLVEKNTRISYLMVIGDYTPPSMASTPTSPTMSWLPGPFLDSIIKYIVYNILEGGLVI